MFITSSLSRASQVSTRQAIFALDRVFFLLDCPWAERETACSLRTDDTSFFLVQKRAEEGVASGPTASRYAAEL